MRISDKSLGTLRYFLITLVVLLVPLGYYFFYYIPSNQSYHTSRNLRLLAETASNLTNRIEGYHGWLDNLTLDNNFIRTEIQEGLKNPEWTVESQSDSQQYINQHILDGISKTLKERFSKVENLTVDYFNFAFNWQESDGEPAQRASSTWSDIYIVSGDKGGAANLHMLYLGHKRNPDYKLDSYDIRLEATLQLKELVRPLLRQEVFDNILIIENSDNKNVIYQQHRDEFIAIRIDTLSSQIRTEFMSGHDQVRLSNSNYKVYSQPIQINNVVKQLPEKSLAAKSQNSGDPSPIAWTIVGLVDADRFNAECRTISHYKIMLFLFLVLIVVISLPLIKLKFIGPLEEITRLDLVLSIFSLIFGAGIITFLLITVYSNKDDERHLDETLNNLSKKVQTHVFDELDSLYTQVHNISVILSKNNDSLFTEIQQNPRTKGIITSCMTDLRVWPFDKDVFPLFTQIAWLEPETGRQVLKLDPDPNSTPLVNVSSRPYYQKIRDKDGWARQFNVGCELCDASETQYYIQPIISLTTGERTEVVSFKDRHHDDYILAVSHNFLSLRHVITPGTFGFAIMDKSGNVLFHSDDDKSLRENFLQETDHDPVLASALFSNTTVNRTLMYQGKEHRVFVRPIKNMDWHLVTFVALSNIHSAELSAAVLSFILFIVLLLWYVLLFFLLRLIFPHKSFAWLMPHRDMETCYQLYFIALFILSGLYFSITFMVGGTVNLILAFLLPPVNLLAMYFLLQFRKPCVLMTRVKTNIPRTAFYLILFFILISCVIAFEGENVSIAYVLFSIFLAIFFLSERVKSFFEKYRLPGFYVSYVASIIAFLMMTSIMPTIGFFRLAYNEEMDILIKNVQLRFASDYDQRTERLEGKYRDIPVAVSGDSIQSAVKIDSFMIARLASDFDIYLQPFQNTKWNTQKSAIIQIDSTKADTLSAILAHLRSGIQIVNPSNWQLYHTQAADNSWTWQNLKSDRIRLIIHPNIDKRHDLNYVESTLHPFHPPTDVQWAWGMMALIVLLVLLTIYFIHKVIILDITLPERKDADAPLFAHNTIFIGPHGSGKSEVVENIPDAFKINFRIIDSVKDYLDELGFGKNIPAQYKTVILDHFDVNIEDQELSALKLALVKRLIATYKKNVIIVSSVDPIRYIEKLKPVQDKNDFGNSWIHTLNSFTKVFHNVRSVDEEFNKKVIEYSMERTNLDDQSMLEKNEDFCTTLIAECNHTPFLRQVGLEMLQRFDFSKHFFNKKAFFAETLQRAATYYESIWRDCSIEEKITLVNLVRNRFFIRKDSSFIRVLLQKGLVIRDDRFRCFNNSFEMYVKEAEKSEDIKQWRKKNARNWGHFRTLVISVIVAIALFIFLTQRETFNQWVALVSTFVAGVPAIFKLFSLVDFSGRKHAIPSSSGEK